MSRTQLYRRLIGFLFILGVCVVGGMFVYFQIAPHRPRLLVKSSLIKNAMATPRNFAWIDTNTAFQENYYGRTDQQSRYYTVTLRDGKTRDLNNISNATVRNGVIVKVAVSPDGTKALILNVDFTNTREIATIFVCNILTDKVAAIVSDMNIHLMDDIFWQSDSSAWYASGYYAVPGRDCYIDKRNLKGLIVWHKKIEPDNQNPDLNGHVSERIGPVINDQLILNKRSFGRINILNGIRKIDLNQLDHYQDYPIPFGELTVYSSILLSPDGKQYSVLALRPPTTIATTMWDKVAQKIKGLPQWTASIYVSDLDGSHAREIGYLRESELPKMQKLFLYRMNSHSFRWTPDGKHLSYILDNKLYTIPID